ncbi:hypothetical protein CP01DC11_1415A, partial [Chlamydia psittaci 01DC11]
MTLINSR